MTPEAETQKTRMGCNTSKCDCNFENETVSALKAHLERQYGPLGVHYDSIWKVTLIILVIEALLWAGFKGLRWYRRRRAQKKAFKGRAAWDSWLAQTQGHGMPANTAALLGPQAAFIPGPPPAPSAPPLPLSNSPPTTTPTSTPTPYFFNSPRTTEVSHRHPRAEEGPNRSVRTQRRNYGQSCHRMPIKRERTKVTCDRKNPVKVLSNLRIYYFFSSIKFKNNYLLI